MSDDLIKAVVPPNCTIIVVGGPADGNSTGTTDRGFTYRGRDDDTNALIYILVVISIYVFSLAFFFVKFLKNKQTKDAKLYEYLDDSMIRERMRRRLQVETFRVRLDKAAYRERLAEEELAALTTEEAEYEREYAAAHNNHNNRLNQSIMSDPGYRITIKTRNNDNKRRKSVQFIDKPSLKVV